AYLVAEIEPPAEPARLALVQGVEALILVVDPLLAGERADLAARTIERLGVLPFQLGYPPVASRTRHALASIAEARGDHPRAVALLEQDYYASRAAGDDADALEAAGSLINVAADSMGARALAERWIGIARADIERRPASESAAQVLSSIAQYE